MSKDRLDVYWGDDALPVGQIARTGAEVTFRYEARPSADRRVSHSLPVDDGVAYPATFFENLLPDGIQRERLARRLGVGDTSTFAMLEAVGGDCAGALSIVPEGESPVPAGKQRVLDEELFRRILLVGAAPISIDEGVRLSLAGAQDKLPVVVTDGDVIVLPGGATASTHILKLPGRDFGGLCANEHFMLELAAQVGLPVARSRVINVFGTNTLLVERFDREDGRRLQQEDCCQALGLPSTLKYEVDGGPSLIDVVALLTAASAEPSDVFTLVEWQAFNIATGNNDGHSKNISLLREPFVRLAPFYDLVCTRAWPQVSKKLALAVGGHHDAGQIGAHAWTSFAIEASLSPKAVVRRVKAMAESVADNLDLVAERVINAGVEARPVRACLQQVKTHAKRTLKLVSSESN